MAEIDANELLTIIGEQEVMRRKMNEQFMRMAREIEVLRAELDEMKEARNAGDVESSG